ncbi:hypothetical protein V6O07_14175, partial [Arthrospira platensis SPKY2]
QEKAMLLLEELMADAQPNAEALDNLVKDILKGRADAKANQRSNFSALVDFATYGENSPTRNQVSEAELKAMKPQDLISVIKKMNSFEHEILYFGPSALKQVQSLVDKN